MNNLIEKDKSGNLTNAECVKFISIVSRDILEAIEKEDFELLDDVISKINMMPGLFDRNITKLMYINIGWAYKKLIELKSSNIEKTTTTYLVANTTSGLYKIGKTTNSVKKRVSQFENISGGNCYIVSQIKMDIEKNLHDMFSLNRVKGEWFNLSGEQVETIKSIMESNNVFKFTKAA